MTRIDRLARSTFDLFSIVKRIGDAGEQFRLLAEPWADSSTRGPLLPDRKIIEVPGHSLGDAMLLQPA